jgi:hypothetical protein
LPAGIGFDFRDFIGDIQGMNSGNDSKRDLRYTTHPDIKRDEFKPQIKGDPSKILRFFQNGVSEDKTLRFEDGPGETFILRVSVMRIYREATEKAAGCVGVEELPLDQATVSKIERPTADVAFQGADFVLFEGTPGSLKEWAGINQKSMRPRA